MDAMNLEQKQREEARWRILRVLDAGRPIAVSETIVWRVLADIKLTITLNALRRELSYLRDRGLAEIEGEDNETWYARLTASGGRRGRVHGAGAGRDRAPAQVLVRAR